FGGGSAVRLLPRFRVCRSFLVVLVDPVYRHDHHRRDGIAPRRLARCAVRDAVSVFDRSRSDEAAERAELCRRAVRGRLCVVRSRHDPVPGVGAAWACRHLAPLAKLFRVVAIQIPARRGRPQMSETALLQVEKLEVVYHRNITAVQGISLSVHAGQIVAILGSNGAGKSTTLRAISGFLGVDDARVTDGSVTFNGRRIENRPPNEITRLGIVLVPERDKVFPNLTVAENLAAPFSPSQYNRRDSEDIAYQFFPRLAELRTRTAGLLSGGERQMLALASALVCRPELLLVDELSLGLAPVVVEELIGRLAQIRHELGITIVIVEQSAAVALSVADYGYVLENGQVVLDGDGARLRAHGDIQEFYLGQSSGSDRRSYRTVKQYRRSRRWYG